MAEMADRHASMASPLAGLGLVDRAGFATLREAPVDVRLVLRGAAVTSGACDAVLGLAPPRRVNTAATAGERAVLCLGPDEWLVLDGSGSPPDLGQRLETAAAGRPFALIDVSHRSTALVLEGPAVEAVLAAGCPLPLDGEAFPVGRATRTLFAKAEVMLWRQAPDRFQIDIARSFAAYLALSLGQAVIDEALIRGRASP